MPSSNLFQVSNDIPEETILPKGAKPNAPSGTLSNHHNDGGHMGNMDDVDRGGRPDAPSLDTDIRG